MNFKSYTGITWTNLELSELLEDENCYVYFERIKKHLGLHPFHLTNLNAALNEILDSNLNSYDVDLKGFLLAYQNPKLLTTLGEIVYDSCFIHVDIEADFYIFRPKVGAKLKGTVNKKGISHLGVMVHKVFNVSIPKPEDEEDWPGYTMEIGQEIKFEVTHLDLNVKLPFIRGILNKDECFEGCRAFEYNCEKEINANVLMSGSSTNRKRHNSLSWIEAGAEDDDVFTKPLVTKVTKQKKSSKWSRSVCTMDHNETQIEEGEPSKKRSKKVKTLDSDIESEVDCPVSNNISSDKIKIKKISNEYKDSESTVLDEDNSTSNIKKKTKKSTSKEYFAKPEILDSEAEHEQIKSKVKAAINSNRDVENSDDEPKIIMKKKTKKKLLIQTNDGITDDFVTDTEDKERVSKKKCSKTDESDIEFDLTRVKKEKLLQENSAGREKLRSGSKSRLNITKVEKLSVNNIQDCLDKQEEYLAEKNTKEKNHWIKINDTNKDHLVTNTKSNTTVKKKKHLRADESDVDFDLERVKNEKLSDACTDTECKSNIRKHKSAVSDSQENVKHKKRSKKLLTEENSDFNVSILDLTDITVKSEKPSDSEKGSNKAVEPVSNNLPNVEIKEETSGERISNERSPRKNKNLLYSVEKKERDNIEIKAESQNEKKEKFSHKKNKSLLRFSTNDNDGEEQCEKKSPTKHVKVEMEENASKGS
ncbi:transcriptional regulator ATRX homolog [Prorops nasuta]|uniref:transcriptional regulator ATRX homolog n=1 Tax=Prorops nasuta TaxID=863751 RepID=UPI0034CFC112